MSFSQGVTRTRCGLGPLAFGILALLALGSPAARAQAIEWVDPPEGSTAVAVDFEEAHYPARIRSAVKAPDSGDPLAGIDHIQVLEAELLGGPFKGQTVQIFNVVSTDSPYEFPVEAGDKALIEVRIEDGRIIDAQVMDRYRLGGLWLLGAIFMAALLIIGRLTGLMSLAALFATVAAVWLIFIPRTLAGAAPLPLALGVCVFSTLLTLPLIGGLGKKTLGAVIGTLGGLAVAALLAVGFGAAMHFTGLVRSEAVALQQSVGHVDLRGILFAGMVLGALGAVMDVAVSIAGAVEELHCADPDMGVKRLFAAAMNIGRGIMGTMTNTLVLAYLGSALPMLLVIASVYGGADLKLLNLEVISAEAVKGLAGTVGLFCAIPLTALVTALMIGGKPDCEDEFAEYAPE